MAKKSAVEKNNRRKRMVALKGRGQAAPHCGRRSVTGHCRWKSVSRRCSSCPKLPRDSARTRLRNRCEISGRPRGYDRKLRMSRIALRDLGLDGAGARCREVELVSEE